MILSVLALVLGVLAYGVAGARLSDGAQAEGGALTSPAWWIGTALQGAGFVFTLAARQHLPLLIVQACVVGGLAVTAIIQHVAGTRRIGGWDACALIAVILAGRSTRAALVTVPLGGTAGVAIPWAWWASRSDETGLWLVGLIILVIGVWVGLSIAVVLADNIRRRRGR